MNKKYLIQSFGGFSMGVWEAKTSAEALLKFHRARGFGPNEVWIEDGKLCFKDGDWEDFMGPPGSWIVQTVGRAD